MPGERLRSGQKRALLISFVLLTSMVGVAAGAHIMGTVPTEGPAPIQAQDGMTGFLETSGFDQVNWEENFPTSGSIEFVTEQGNVTFFSSGPANVTIHTSNITGTYTNVTAIDADPNTITIDPGDKDSAVVGQEIDTFAYRAGIAADDGTVDFSYTASANARVTVQGVAASTDFAAVDADTGQRIDTATSTGGGAVTFNGLDSGDHDVLVQAFDPYTPQFSNPSPTGETTSAPTQVSVDVSDGDFPRGDSVDVTIDVDGNQIHSETITSNQTVTANVPMSGQTGGTHSWSVEATDSYGESNSDSYQYQVPQNVAILNEEPPHGLITQQVNLTVYTRGDTPQILNYTTSNGQVDLGNNFPSGEPFIVVAESQGYLDRRILVQSLYETQTLYLLNESVQHTDIIFRIEDYSGRFPPDETALQVQRGINGSWQTVLGDYFGANDQFTAQIKYNTRHRLILTNTNTGETRILGSYTPLTSGTETLTISPAGTIDLPDTHPTFEFTPTTRTLPAENGVDVSATIRNGTMALDSWSVSMYNVDGMTNNTLFTDSSTDPSGGTLSSSLNLAGLEGRVKVVIGYTVNGGASGTQVAYYNIAQEPTQSMTLLDGLLAMVGLVPNSDSELVLTLTAMIGIVVGTAAVGSVFRLSTEMMGLITLALTAAFAVLGWVDYSLLFTVLVLFAALAFLRRRY